MQLHLEYLQERITYTGQELRPHWISQKIKYFGNALVAFRGPCYVKTQELVDLEDARQNAFIKAEEMLHFLGEFFGESLELTIAKQRLLIASFAEQLTKKIDSTKFTLNRRGNDLFLQKKSTETVYKLSVAIVTASPVSTILHFGVNINPTGAPVNAAGLNELNIQIDNFVLEVFETWKQELLSLEKARCKVLPRV